MLISGKTWTILGRIIILVAGAFALFVFMGVVMVVYQQWVAEPRLDRVEQNRIRIEKNKVRIGMTTNDVLLQVHAGMRITAFAVVDADRAYYAPDEFRLVKQTNGTFTLSGYYWGERLSGNLTEAQDHERMTKPEQVFEDLTESKAAELMKQKMSDGCEWRWKYTFANGMLESSFTVSFGRDGLVKDITDVHVTDLFYHRA